MSDNIENKKTRIVCTIGPSTDSEEMLKKLISNGMNVARLNTSHDSIQEHERRVMLLKKVRKEMNVPLAILLDLEGPKIRTGNFETDQVLLEEGKQFILTTEDIIGNAERVSINYKELPKEVKSGVIILLDDGKIKLEVLKVDGKEITTKILVGGYITHHRGINVPGVDISLPPLTQKDKDYLVKAMEWDIDYIAQSFVRKPEDIIKTKRVLTEMGIPDLPIIAKIETLQAIDNLEAIIEEADGVMVARGDLGVEAPVEQIPLLQKRIIEIANTMAKPVITATQMLETMINNPFPTRAEATDIANAILDGTDAVMLSGETSIGKYPAEAVKVMSKVALETEKYLDDYSYKFEYSTYGGGDPSTNAISLSAIKVAEQLGINVIVATTYSGYTARAISRFRRNIKIIAASPRQVIYNRLALVWGVTPVIMQKFTDTDTMLENVTNIVKSLNFGVSGENIVITAGIPYGFSSKTNLLKIHEI
ncbi:pyruvate kinase [Petrotoga sp. 9PWA.NaAc.5.4]|uniref:pyruvate kinase n=1 Tax=Petrotoga sp. 9PWA.NaAc.5.4 TaxID=1434328 RepID=UPI000CB3E7E8|nr:pyruvate kinase [Petrotoga sp. 9PWA.NaAc.5.4]PNR94143.1 pyruvate kinase [Petrotoga sp. 9PWA.NaAc.5.4]